MPQLSALFQQKEGWIGADGAHSVALTPQRTLWLFSDTWVGSIRDGKRSGAGLVNNTVALQDGRGADARLQFVVRQGDDRKPTALLTPADQHGWFWLQAGVCVQDRLFLFLSQIEKTKDPGVFGFRQVGQTLGIVANPHDPPTEWRVEQRKLPCAIFTPQRVLTFGAALWQDTEFLYIFGTDEDIAPGGPDRYLIAARVPLGSVADVAAWRYYRDGQWIAEFRDASRLVRHMASEVSVSYLPQFKRYVLVYTQNGLSPRILARSAPRPADPGRRRRPFTNVRKWAGTKKSSATRLRPMRLWPMGTN